MNYFLQLYHISQSISLLTVFSSIVGTHQTRVEMSSDGGQEGAAQPAAAAAGDNQQPQQRGWGATFRAMLFQMMIFYAISSFFRSPRTNTGTNITAGPGKNMFSRGQEMVGMFCWQSVLYCCHRNCIYSCLKKKILLISMTAMH